jgi:hypothetical protein
MIRKLVPFFLAALAALTTVTNAAAMIVWGD